MALESAPSEDVSYLLAKPACAAGEFEADAPRDYLPDPKIDWVVTVELGEAASRENIVGVLDAAWLEEHGRPTVHGFSPDEEHWTFVNAADSPETFSRLKIAWPLWDAITGKPRDVSPNDLERHKAAAESALAALGGFNARVDRSPEDALAFVATFAELVAECDRDVTLRLVAPDGENFSGREVWDVMLCLGLDYGDGDMFHWINNSGFGDDHFFTVETSTPPGYFIPQRMASGKGDVHDLVFSFSIPRSAGPAAVFDSMARAVEYAQKRLGGEIVTGAGESFNRAADRAWVENVVQKLRQAGFQPGQSPTLRIF